MRIAPSLLWTWNHKLDRLPYLLAGVLLFLLKFAIDRTIAAWFFHQDWSPLNYLLWPNDRVVRVFELDHPEQSFCLAMLLMSLPFIWTGVMLTLHRLRAAGLPRGLVVFFFLPLANLVLFLILVLLPTQPAAEAGAGSTPVARPLDPWRTAHRDFVGESYWRSGLVAIAVSVPLVILAVVWGAQVLESYGFSLFIGAPFALGLISVLIFGFSRPQPAGACLAVAMWSGTVAGLVILLIALEGAICLLMAAPIAYTLLILGALIGIAIQSRPWLSDQTAALTLAVVLLLPSLMAAESAGEPAPDVRELRTEVLIDAPTDQVWPHVISFPPLPEPDEWFFRAGVAYPQRAEIRGTGVGAVRHCVFSTGTFVEPIQIWNPPTRLRFSVTEQPPPMHELSPYHIHPPHLNHYLMSRQGEFLLESLPGGRTRLVGTTW